MAIQPGDIENIRRGDVLVLKGVMGREGIYKTVVLDRQGFRVKFAYLVRGDKRLDFRCAPSEIYLNPKKNELKLKEKKIEVLAVLKGAGLESNETLSSSAENAIRDGEFVLNGIFLFGSS